MTNDHGDDEDEDGDDDDDEGDGDDDVDDDDDEDEHDEHDDDDDHYDDDDECYFSFTKRACDVFVYNAHAFCSFTTCTRFSLTKPCSRSF